MSSKEDTAERNGKVSIAEIENLGAVLSRITDRLDEFADRMDRIEAKLDQVTEDSDRALALASGAAVPQQAKPKIEIAAEAARDHLVQRAVNGRTGKAAVKVGDVEKLTGPHTQIDRRTIYDSWEKLLEAWPDVFTIDDTPDRQKSLRVAVGDIPPELSTLVEENSRRRGGSEKLTTPRSGGGG